MKPVTKMVWLFVLIIVASALCFVLLDDEDTKVSPTSQPQTTQSR